jgi:hypothetical protein
MSLHNWIVAQPRTVKILRIAGLVIFFVAFFLPACHDTESGSIVHSARFVGWECAWLSFSMMADSGAFSSPLFFAFLGGCINPLIVIYLLLSLTKKYARTRKVIALAVLVFMVSTWVFFVLAHFVPLIGHVLWIAGALLILYPEFAGLLRRRDGTPAVTEPLSKIAMK